MSTTTNKPALFPAILCILLLLGGALGAWFLPPGWNFAILLAALTGLVLVLGRTITEKPLGALINERKLMSLSRFQMALWTVVVLAGFGAMVALRLKAGIPDALSIEVDWRLWALLGISTTSLVGSPLVLSSKIPKEPAKDVVKETADEFNESEADVNRNRSGILYGNTDAKDARWTDMFEGDELKTTAYLDLGKLQMFFFTVLLVIVYVGMLVRFITATPAVDLTSFPVFSEGMIALLGISHAGYLANQGITRTKTQ
jgi:hypothetical protein